MKQRRSRLVVHPTRRRRPRLLSYIQLSTYSQMTETHARPRPRMHVCDPMHDLGSLEAAALVALGVCIRARLDAELPFPLGGDEGRVRLHAVQELQLVLDRRREVVV